MALGVFTSAGIVDLWLPEPRAITSVGDLLFYSLDELEAIADEKGGILALLDAKWRKVYKTASPHGLYADCSPSARCVPPEPQRDLSAASKNCSINGASFFGGCRGGMRYKKEGWRELESSTRHPIGTGRRNGRLSAANGALAPSSLS